MTDATVEILDPGSSTTIQDAGRRGYEQWGVTVSGALDRRSLRRVNAQLGQDADAPVLESLLGGLELRVDTGRWCSLAGAPASVSVDGADAPDPLLFFAPAGARVRIGTPRRGLYTYLAIAGGIRPTAVLGSASTDTLSGIGPDRLAAGAVLPLGEPATPLWNTDVPAPRVPRDHLEVSFLWGPRDDVFPEADRALLTGTAWTVGGETNRVGSRLDGGALSAGSGSLPSEGVVRGSIQIPPSGQPIVFLADHPVTGGYPVIGVVCEDDQDLLAQAPPGTLLHLRPRPA